MIIELDIPKVVNKVSIICPQDDKDYSGVKSCSDINVSLFTSSFSLAQRMNEVWSIK